MREISVMELSPINKYSDAKEWWKQNKRLLHKTIGKTIENGYVDVEILKTMQQLLDKIEIKEKFIMKRRGWSYTEEKKLIDNYDKMTIKELLVLFPNRRVDSINCKIKRLKAVGKLTGGKTKETKHRSYIQRGKGLFKQAE